VSKCNCSSQKPLPTTGIWTRDLWFRSLDLRPLDQPAVYVLFLAVRAMLEPQESMSGSEWNKNTCLRDVVASVNCTVVQLLVSLYNSQIFWISVSHIKSASQLINYAGRTLQHLVLLIFIEKQFSTYYTNNWDPLVLGPEFAMDRIPLPVWCRFGRTSSSNGFFHIDSPPRPVPVGSPPWIW
jgi:hypothetical protein